MLKHNKAANVQLDRILLYSALIGLMVLHTEEVPLLHMVCSVLRAISFVLLFPQLIVRKKKLEWFHYILIAYFFLLLYSSIINGQRLNGLISKAITIFTILAALKIDFEKNVNQTLRTLTVVFSGFVIVNFFLVLLYPDGIWKHVSDVTGEIVGDYILGGNRNQMGSVLVVGYLTSTLYSLKTKRLRKLNYIIMLSALISLLIGGSRTSILGMIGISLFNYSKSERIHNMALLFMIIGYFVFQFVAVFLLTDFSSNHYISYFVEEVLGKDLTFSGRSGIWEQSTLLILLSPIWGYGLYDSDFLMFNISTISPHNFILSILLKGGICLLICALILFAFAIKQAYKYKTSMSLMLIFGLWILLFMSIMEVYSFILYVYLLSLLNYSKFFCLKKTLVNNKIK